VTLTFPKAVSSTPCKHGQESYEEGRSPSTKGDEGKEGISKFDEVKELRKSYCFNS